ncbi:MAG: flavodoxin family protein [Ectothiorhodospiraceae bacterium]|nr:flavodoxin family protein [Ectothiorhodospiraceae bacterium]
MCPHSEMTDARPRHVVGIVGSYRVDGVVDTAVGVLLARAREAGATTRRIRLIERRIEFCTNCRSCMQTPGPSRGACVLVDDLDSTLAEIDSADALVLGSPVNFGNVTAVTRCFMERCVGHAYWPWGQPAPRMRDSEPRREAVLVASSAAPAWMGRWLTGARPALAKLARLLGARPIATVWIGGVSRDVWPLPAHAQRRLQALGERLAGRC